MPKLHGVTLATALAAGVAVTAAQGIAEAQHSSTGPSTELRTGAARHRPDPASRINVQRYLNKAHLLGLRALIVPSLF